MVARYAALIARKAAVSSTVAARRAVGRALALHLLNRTARGAWTIEEAPSGQPMAHGPVPRHVSISHTGSTVVAAASALGPVGIDIERPKPARNLARLAQRAFGPAEQAAVARLGSAAFYRVWTLREAISKATGLGMEQAADGIDRVPTRLIAGEAEGMWTEAEGSWLLAHTVLGESALGFAIQATDGQRLLAVRLADLRLAP